MSNGGISPNRPRSGACKYRRQLSIFKKALANESESPDPAEGGTPWPNRRGLPWHIGSSKYMNGNQPRVPEGRCRGKRYQDQTAHHSTARSMSFSLGTPRPNHAPGIERSISGRYTTNTLRCRCTRPIYPVSRETPVPPPSSWNI